MFIVYSLARLLNNLIIWREDNNKRGVIDIIVYPLTFLFYFCSLPVAAVVYGVHNYIYQRALLRTEQETRNKQKEYYSKLESKIEDIKTLYYFKGKEDGVKIGYEDGYGDVWFDGLNSHKNEKDHARGR